MTCSVGGSGEVADGSVTTKRNACFVSKTQRGFTEDEELRDDVAGTSEAAATVGENPQHAAGGMIWTHPTER